MRCQARPPNVEAVRPAGKLAEPTAEPADGPNDGTRNAGVPGDWPRRTTMKGYLAVFACFVLACSSSFADSWALKPEVKDTPYVFGDTRIILHYDSTQNRQYPKYKMSVYLKGKLVGEHDDIGFEQVYASPGNAYFLGVSNRGLIRQAYVIFDRNGQILRIQPHDPREVHYCSLSVTLIREWYNKDEPDVRFIVVDGKLKDVRISACDGTRVSLLIREDLDLRAFLLEYLLENHAKPNEVCYVSFGAESNEDGKAIARRDPPKRFLDRFQHRPYRIKPASAYPKPRGTEPWPKNNPQTGIPDGIYTVEIVKWLDKNAASVKVSMYRNGLWARGESLVVERHDGKWRIEEHGEAWAA